MAAHGCSNCDPIPEPVSVKCQTCGQIAEPGASFCEACGASLQNLSGPMSSGIDWSRPIAGSDPNYWNQNATPGWTDSTPRWEDVAGSASALNTTHGASSGTAMFKAIGISVAFMVSMALMRFAIVYWMVRAPLTGQGVGSLFGALTMVIPLVLAIYVYQRSGSGWGIAIFFAMWIALPFWLYQQFREDEYAEIGTFAFVGIALAVAFTICLLGMAHARPATVDVSFPEFVRRVVLPFGF